MQSTKDQVLQLLKQAGNSFLSGQDIADSLYVSRAAVWKAIKALQSKGIEIEAVSNKGYRLLESTDALNALEIWEAYRSNRVNGSMIMQGGLLTEEDILVYDEVDSTNDVANNIEAQQSVEGYKKDKVVLAEGQRNGRGRRGRTFVSPRGSGLYMSFLLHPQMDFSQATLLTCITAVAVCRAIEKAAGIAPSIKWVNDLYLENKKIAGILTEGHASLEDGGLDHVVVGIGINIGQPRGGWPGELTGIAGCLRDSTNANPDRNILAGYIISELESAMATPSGELVEEYRNRSMLIGKYVQINSFGREQAKSRKEYALVTGIDDNCRLLVRMDSGAEAALSTGEVSVVQY